MNPSQSHTHTPNPQPNNPWAPHDPWAPHPATLRSIRSDFIPSTPSSPNVFTIELELHPSPFAENYHFLPGQFNMLHLPGAGEVAISHCGPHSPPNPLQPLTIQHPRQGCFLHTIRAVGRVTNAIAQLKPGDHIGVRGPFGNPWPIDPLEGNDILLLAGGLGLAPLRPVIYAFIKQRDRFGSISLLIGARNPHTVLYAQELEAWAQAGIHIEITVDQPQTTNAPIPSQLRAWDLNLGPITLLLDRRHNKNSSPTLHPNQTKVLICGPEIMMHYCALNARKLGVPANSIWISMERNMQCGAGYCGHCQWGPFFLCKDGPVLRYDLAEPFLNIKDL